jgi:hypothetical protein
MLLKLCGIMLFNFMALILIVLLPCILVSIKLSCQQMHYLLKTENATMCI